MPEPTKHTKARLKAALVGAVTMKDVIRNLGISTSSGSQWSYIKKRLQHFNLPIPNGAGLRSARSIAARRTNYLELLVYDKYAGNRTEASRLRRALIESGRPYKCEGKQCVVRDAWLGGPITLEVHHGDGDPLNNIPSNLKFLCPNCHSQTHVQHVRVTAKARKHLCECGSPISAQASQCKSCAGKSRYEERVAARPDTITLRNQVADMGFCAVGRIYGVSDNAIRKWLAKAS